jgi:DNA-binding transcriptional MerR regulator
MEGQRYTIDALSELTGYSRRTIRFYIQEGLLAPPAGRGRGGFYNDSHVETLQRIRALQEKGLDLYSIAARLSGRPEGLEAGDLSRQAWAKYEVTDGLNIEVSRQMEDREGRLVMELVRYARTLFREELSND